MLNSVMFVRLQVVAAMAAGLLSASCQRDPEPSAAPSELDKPVDLGPVAPPRISALDRRELLAAVSQAASAYAAGADDVDAAKSLAGRPFDIRLAFGCGGAAAPSADGAGGDAGLGRWSWDDARENITLSLTPDDWTTSALIAGAGRDEWEAVEGFWVARPWMTTDGCSAGRADPLASGPGAPSPQTVGLAAVFESGGSRLGRRNGRAYVHTIRQAGDAPPAPQEAGYRVRMQGRIAAFPDGRAIHCRAASPDQRPVCVAAIQLDRVAFETPAGDTLSEWRSG